MESLKDSILELRAEGLSYKAIVDRLGCAKSTVSYYVSEGQKEKAGVRAVGTRQRWRDEISEIKKVPCLDCKGTFPPECMDFDHVVEGKSDNIARLITKGNWQNVLEEIKKCEIVCANCHRIRTKARGTSGWML